MAGYTSVGTPATPNLETIASLHPDLIIADADRDAKIYNQLQNIAPTIALDSLKQAYLPNLHAAIVDRPGREQVRRDGVRVAQDKLVMARMKAAVTKATNGKGEKRKAMFVVTTNKVFNVHSDLAYTPSLLAGDRDPGATLPVNRRRRQPVPGADVESLLYEQPGDHVRRAEPAEPDDRPELRQEPALDQI